MQPAELDALNQPISNEARVLYCLGFRPIADLQTGLTAPLHYKTLLALLNGKKQEFTLGRQLNSLIKELINVGLVNFQSDEDLNRSFNRKQIVLPLLALKQDDYTQLHRQYSAMTMDFVPHPSLFDDLAKLVGIIDAQFNDAELGDFVAYWLGRPDTQCSVFQWTQKFVFNLKQKRLATQLKPAHVKQVGQQVVASQPGVELDDNAKKLIEKYGQKDRS